MTQQVDHVTTRARLPAAVIALGVTSFFTDAGSEMIFPLLPVFMVSLGAAPAFLGLVEGLADATSSLLKLATGYLADRMPQKKPIVLLGYGIATFVRPLMGLVAVPWQALTVRVADRVGKGIRSSPRDVLIASAVPADQSGRAFGLHRAMDHAGAVVGPLLATLLLSLGWSMRQVFLCSIVPGLFALGALTTVREVAPRSSAIAPSSDTKTVHAPLPRAFVGYLIILGLFALGNSSDAFLLLRARELGVSTALLPTLWVVLHISKMLSSYYGGALADRLPRTRLIVAGWMIYGLTYLGLGLASSAWHVWALFGVYGLYYGLTEPTEKALVKDLTPHEAQGRAFGFYNFVIGVSAVPAGLLTGFVWQSAGPRAALSMGAAIAVVSGIALAVWNGARTRPT
jgi:MFS family permease